MKLEPSRRVRVDRLIRDHERRKWQPISVLRSDSQRDVRALILGQRLQN